MLRSAFAGFAAAGIREIRLGVASYNPRALYVYERLGMIERYRFDVYERPAHPATITVTPRSVGRQVRAFSPRARQWGTGVARCAQDRRRCRDRLLVPGPR